MIINRKVKARVLALVAFMAVIGVAALAYRTVTWVHEDLDRLAEYSITQGYAALFQAIHAQEVGPEGFTFVVLGDTRSNMPVAHEVLRRAAAENPAFIINTGDLVRHGTVEEYITYHMPLVELAAPIPYVPIPGNHDDGPNRDFAAFKALYGAERFSFDYGNCRFVGVNTSDRLRMGWADLRYLETELGKPGAKWKFVVLHIPPDYVVSAGGRSFKWNTKRFQRLMQRMKVTHVFMGHIHGYATEVADGIPYTISAGGGAPLTTTLGKEGNVRNYVVMHVRPEGVKGEVVRLLGNQWVRSEIR